MVAAWNGHVSVATALLKAGASAKAAMPAGVDRAVDREGEGPH
jgi:hypothetical protein